MGLGWVKVEDEISEGTIRGEAIGGGEDYGEGKMASLSKETSSLKYTSDNGAESRSTCLTNGIIPKVCLISERRGDHPNRTSRPADSDPLSSFDGILNPPLGC